MDKEDEFKISCSWKPAINDLCLRHCSSQAMSRNYPMQGKKLQSWKLSYARQEINNFTKYKENFRAVEQKSKL